MLRRRVRVCEHYRIPWEPKNLLKRYEFYDQSRDSMFYLSWHTLWKASFPPTPPDLHAFFHSSREEHKVMTPPAMGPSPHCNFKNWYDAQNANSSSWLSPEERKLARMMGIFGYINPFNYVQITTDENGQFQETKGKCRSTLLLLLLDSTEIVFAGKLLEPHTLS